MFIEGFAVAWVVFAFPAAWRSYGELRLQGSTAVPAALRSVIYGVTLPISDLFQAVQQFVASQKQS